jgi:predicted 2-oxoglutarate/Fe(II)-dependent dioxygenase YbiX
MKKQELDGSNVFTIHQFFSKDEAEHWIAHSEALGYQEAPLSTAQGPVIDKSVRNNSRIMVDDPVLAEQLWDRLRSFLPPISGWEAVGLNERFRFYRYEVAEKFALHYDGCFRRENGERSQLTFMVYLNEGFDGGETGFYRPNGSPRFAVQPEQGKALIFAHHQLHEGAPVRSGRKYVLRTDVRYRRTGAGVP